MFPYTTRADAERVYVSFAVLDGYYLYRTRFGFGSKTDGVSIGAAAFPKGEIHSDEYFGEQEIYRGKFEVAIPYRRTGNATQARSAAEAAGLRDGGLCYLPQDWTAAVALPAQSPFELARRATGASATDDLLPVDDAFTVNARFDRPNELTVGWQIAPDYYLYRDKLTFALDGGVELGRAALPDGVAHYDDNFGDVRVFYDYVEVKVPFSRSSPDALDLVLTAGFQGCKEDSICYPPGEQTMALVLPATSRVPGEHRTRRAAARVRARPVGRPDRERLVVAAARRFLPRGSVAVLHAVRAADGADPLEHHRGPRRHASRRAVASSCP